MELLHYCIYIYEIDCFPYEHDIDKHVKHKMKQAKFAKVIHPLIYFVTFTKYFRYENSLLR